MVTSQDFLLSNRYRITDEIGKGGMGTVYKAKDRLTGNLVAIKRVMIDTNNLQFASKSSSGDFKLALAREFRTLSSLRHPNIISVLDYGFHKNGPYAVAQPYFAMELLENPQTIIQAGRGLPFEEQIGLLMQMVQALAYLHRRGILHRDLKPDNVLVITDDEGKLRVKVLDFGLAMNHDTVYGDDEEPSGTLAYMAPEVLQGAPPTTTADMYAVGVIMYELLAGKHPFNTTDAAQLVREVIQTLPDVWSLDLNFEIQEVIAWLLAKYPEDRFADAEHVINVFAQATGQSIPRETEKIRESYLQAANFVGRQQELFQLTGALDKIIVQSKSRKEIGSVWLIGGESGVGKSRLLDEVRAQAMVDGALVLRGQTEQSGAYPYLIWRDVIRVLCLQTILSPTEIGILKQVIPDIDRLLLDETLAGDEGSKDIQRDRFYEVITLILEEQPRPVVIILEDLHHMRDDSLHLLQHIAKVIKSLPVLILASYRNDERPNLPFALPYAEIIELERLPHEQIVQLSESMLGEAGRDQRIIDMLERETEGNVFFIVEAVRALAEESGELAQVGRKTLPPRIFAEGMKSVVRRRLDSVTMDARPLLYIAAAMGRQLDLDVLQAIESPMAFGDWLYQCEMAFILEVHDNHWRFVHDKLREGLLAQVNERAHKDLHRQIAEAIEIVHERDQKQVQRLLYHWQRAGDRHKRLDYTILAAQQALENEDFKEALELTENAARFSKLIKAEPDLRARLRLMMGDIYIRTGRFQDAYDILKGAQKFAQKHNLSMETSDALNLLGTVTSKWNGDFETALGYYQESLEIQNVRGDKAHIARAMSAIGRMQVHLGQLDEARAQFDASIAISRDIDDQKILAENLTHLGDLAMRQQDPEAAENDYLEALKIFEAAGNRSETCHTKLHLAQSQMQRGLYPSAQRHNTEATRIAWQINARQYIHRAIQNQAHLYAHTGRDALAMMLIAFSRGQTGHTEALNHIGHLDLAADLRERLSDEVYKAALEKSRLYDLDSIVRLILAEVPVQD